MSVYTDVIQDVGLGTGTAKTELSGNLSGSAADYTLPAAARGVLFVQPTLYQTTPTANQTLVASLKVESDDLGLKDYEVLANPVGSNVATTNVGQGDLQRGSIYPAFWPTKGGEKMQFYGIPQTANTAAPNMGATIWWTDDPRDMTDMPYRARIGGAAGAAGSGTSTGTATGSVSGATITISSGGTRRVKIATGIVSATTLATAKPIAGYFVWGAPELAFTLRANFEPVQGPLGTAQAFAHLTRLDNLNVPLNTPSTIAQNIYLTAAPSTAGNFYQGLLYQ